MFQQPRPESGQFVYLWADGIHFDTRLDHELLCCLVLNDVRATVVKNSWLSAMATAS